MYCNICSKPFRAEIIEDWAYSESLRRTAARYGVSYRSLQRHLDLCLASICAERENRAYKAEFDDVAEWLRFYFRLQMRKPRRRSIITKPIEYTWSRRSWKGKKGLK